MTPTARLRMFSAREVKNASMGVGWIRETFHRPAHMQNAVDDDPLWRCGDPAGSAPLDSAPFARPSSAIFSDLGDSLVCLYSDAVIRF